MEKYAPISPPYIDENGEEVTPELDLVDDVDSVDRKACDIRCEEGSPLYMIRPSQASMLSHRKRMWMLPSMERMGLYEVWKMGCRQETLRSRS